MWLWKRRKIKMIPITEAPKKAKKPAVVEVLDPFFKILQENVGKGVYIQEFPNPQTNEVDFCGIYLDLRIMRMMEAEYAEASSEGTPSEGQ